LKILLIIGYWLLVIGYWLLVVGCWLLVVGYLTKESINNYSSLNVGWARICPPYDVYRNVEM